MKTVLTSLALLVRQLSILADNAMANSAISLALKSTKDIASPCEKSVYNAVVAEGDDALSVAEPGIPTALVDGHALCRGCDGGLVEREGGWETDDYGCGLLVVHGVGSVEFRGAGIDTDD